jgi:hypothetical protein
MDKIQSAEEFAEDLSREAHGWGLAEKMTSLIRSRDKAIGLKIREVITNPDLRNSWDYDGHWQCKSGYWLDLNELLPQIDSILREISGDTSGEY